MWGEIKIIKWQINDSICTVYSNQIQDVIFSFAHQYCRFHEEEEEEFTLELETHHKQTAQAADTLVCQTGSYPVWGVEAHVQPKTSVNTQVNNKLRGLNYLLSPDLDSEQTFTVT